MSDSSFSFQDAVLPSLNAIIASLTSILKKAESHASENNIPLDSLVTARLIDDMLPLSFQVHSVTDYVQKVLARVNGTEPLELSVDELTSFEAYYARIEQVKTIVRDTANPEAFASRINAAITIGAGPGRFIDTNVKAYVFGWTFPNMYFHLQTAYAILRAKGIPLGKMDYLLPFFAESGIKL